MAHARDKHLEEEIGRGYITVYSSYVPQEAFVFFTRIGRALFYSPGRPYSKGRKKELGLVCESTVIFLFQGRPQLERP